MMMRMGVIELGGNFGIEEGETREGTPPRRSTWKPDFLPSVFFKLVLQKDNTNAINYFFFLFFRKESMRKLYKLFYCSFYDFFFGFPFCSF